MVSIDAQGIEGIRRRLLEWYDGNRRSLPWREHRDPYRIWIAEVMLQQTQVETVIPYYERFLNRFPSVESLAMAELEDVLSVWQGLGYYQRARWLHQAARELVLTREGELPTTAKELCRLPGFGLYTSRAVASIAFGEAVGVVDGNVRRVLCRLFTLPSPRRAYLQELADRLVDPERPGDFNQALMELGSRVCTPRRPSCTACPIRRWCRAALIGRVEAYPAPRKTRRPREERYWIGIWTHGDRWLLGHRATGLLRDMWLFPMWSRERYPDLPALMTEILREQAGVNRIQFHRLETVEHVFSHRRWVLDPFWVQWPADEKPPDIRTDGGIELRNFVWFPSTQLRNIPIPRAHRKVLACLTEGGVQQRLLVAEGIAQYDRPGE